MTDEQQGPATPAGPPPAPELEKMQAAAERLSTQAIGEFLDWLGEQGIMLCTWSEHIGGGRFHEIAGGRERLLATYAEVDLDKIVQERRALLDYLRSLNS
jgi:hypothetical protein